MSKYLPAGVSSQGRSKNRFFPVGGMGQGLSSQIDYAYFGFLWVPLAFLGSFGFLWVPLGSFGFLWVPLGSFGFLRAPWGSLGFLGVP